MKFLILLSFLFSAVSFGQGIKIPSTFVGSKIFDTPLRIQGNGATLDVFDATSNAGIIQFSDAADGNIGQLRYIHSTDQLEFRVNDANRLIIKSDGTIRNGADTTTFHTGSDLRLKRDIITIDNALDKLMKMRGVYYYWKSKNKPQERQAGMIAQEVQAVLPEAVNEWNDGYLGIEEQEVQGLIVQAIKELSDKVNELEKRINAN